MHIGIGAWQLRDFHEADGPALVKYANNRKVSRFLRDRFPFPYTSEDAQAWLRHVSQEEPKTSFVIASAEELIGGIGLELMDDIYRRTAEIGYWLGEPFWGKGIATLAVRAFTRYAFEQFALLRIQAGILEANPASAAVLEKAGYQLEGRMRQCITKDGVTHDQLVYAILRNPGKSMAK